MAYIGRPSIVGNFVKLDAITAVNGQAAYTMQNNSVNFADYSTVNQFLVSLNGTIQSPGSSFTVSGSTLTFASNLSTGDVIDFIIVFGNSLSAGVPTDDTVSTAKIVDDAVTAAKINNDIISGSTELASEPADTDEFLVSDAGTIKRIDYSLIKGGGQFNLVTRTAITSDVSTVNFTNLEANTYHKFVLQGIDSTDNGGEDISARVSTDNGSSFINSNYQYAYYQFYSSGSTNTTGSGSGSTTADKWRFGDGFHTSGSDEGLHGEFILYNVGNGQRPFFMSQTVHKADTTNRLRATVAGGTNTSGLTVNGVQFFFDSGNITGSSYAFITHYKGVIA